MWKKKFIITYSSVNLHQPCVVHIIFDPLLYWGEQKYAWVSYIELRM